MKICASPLKAVHSKSLAGVLRSSNQKFLQWISTYGAEKIILGADVKGEYIATDGWLETSDQSLFDFLPIIKPKAFNTPFVQILVKTGCYKGLLLIYTKRFCQKPK